MSHAFEADGLVERCGTPSALPGADLAASEPRDAVATARRAALVSWITVIISLPALFLVNGAVP